MRIIEVDWIMKKEEIKIIPKIYNFLSILLSQMGDLKNSEGVEGRQDIEKYINLPMDVSFYFFSVSSWRLKDM